jgi:DNA polymerase (family 10)
VPGVTRAEIAGSYRRGRETVGDLDILLTCRPGTPAVEQFVRYPEVEAIVAEGPTRAAVRLRAGLQVDLRVLDDESYGAGLYYFTGSKAHNIAVRRIAQQQGLKINEYGVFRGNRRVAGRTERDVLRAVGIPWIPPELREDRGEIAAALSGRLPHLVEPADIRGDLQMHTQGSDGRNTLEEMADAARALGYEYIAITDHTPALRMVRGLDARGFRDQARAIDRLNRRLGSLTILRGAEVDILPDGSLDLDDETLTTLDLVIVSIHSQLDLPEKAQTERLLRAVSHPSVHVLRHPTGRLIGRRGGGHIDLPRLFRAAADHGVILEINAQPERLDLDDLAARAAIQAGVKLVISTDAHSVAELGFMRWGVAQARRGWVEPKDLVNTRTHNELVTLLQRKRKAIR